MQLVMQGREITLRPTAKAIEAMERELGQGVVQLAKKLEQGELWFSQLALILFHFLYAQDADKAPSLDEIMQEMVQAGLAESMEIVAELFSELLEGQQHEPLADDGRKLLQEMMQNHPDAKEPAHFETGR